MNEAMPRLHSDPRSAQPSVDVPNLPVVRCADLAANPRPQGREDKAGAFSPSLFGTPGVGGTRAQRIAAADAMRRWMFDPTPEQLGPCARDAEAQQETQVSETA